MAAHGTDAGAGLADVAAQQQQVHQELHGLDAGAMLRQAHAIDPDHPLGPRIDRRRGFEGAARQPRPALDVGPIMRPHRGGELVETVRVLVEKGAVEHRLCTGPASLVLRLDQHLAQPDQRRLVPPGLDLVVLRTDRRRGPGQHLARRLRVRELDQPAFAQRVEGDDRNAAPPRLLQIVQHAWAIAAHILAEEEDAIGFGEILQRHRADRHADAFRQRHRCGLVTHIRAVGQVVRAVKPREQLIHVGGFERGATRGVEHDRFRIECLQLAADRREGIVPADRDVTVALRVPAHRAREPAELFQIVIAPAFELAQRMGGEKPVRNAP